MCVYVLFDAVLPLPLSSGHTTDGPPMQKEALELQVGKQHCLLQQCKRMYMWGGVGWGGVGQQMSTCGPGWGGAANEHMWGGVGWGSK